MSTPFCRQSSCSPKRTILLCHNTPVILPRFVAPRKRNTSLWTRYLFGRGDGRCRNRLSAAALRFGPKREAAGKQINNLTRLTRQLSYYTQSTQEKFAKQANYE